MARASSAFRRQALILSVLAALSMAGYALYSNLQHGPGFPLDDAWIHATYARNLAQYGEWAFIPGQPSSAATSVVWVLLLAPGAWLGLAPTLWAWLLGWLALWLTGVMGMAVIAQLAPQQARWAPWVGALLVLEYHLVWAALSGMETVLFAALCLTALHLALRPVAHAVAAGALAGLAMLVRPEGLTLLVPLAVAVLAMRRNRLRSLLQLAVGLLLFLVPYLFFNHSLSGTWWPSTLYAKQAEYAALLAQPVWLRWAAQAAAPLTGLGLVALPGFVLLVVDAIRQRTWLRLAWVAWVLGFLLLFALRLPVVYQYGRYAMPVLPVYLVLSVAGAASALTHMRNPAWRRRLAAAWLASAALVAVAFYALGARAFQRDVAFIETQMVATARWVAANTATDARLAAHDIGALGYFAPRLLMDLAGLVTPELVPFMQDETQLAAYLDQAGVEYLVAFPHWYDQLPAGQELLYRAQAYADEAGLGRLSVYRWVGAP
ncbi:MAG: hypothetical protein KIT08_09295 [Anaerolineales bacterium]|nr:MAG: hypothetical protein KIT08_09295 [Anaerolineales bacterium]